MTGYLEKNNFKSFCLIQQMETIAVTHLSKKVLLTVALLCTLSYYLKDENSTVASLHF